MSPQPQLQDEFSDPYAGEPLGVDDSTDPTAGEPLGWGDTITDLVKSAGSAMYDVGAGAVKGAAQSLTGPARLAGSAINRMSAKSFGRAPIDLSAGDDFLAQLDSTNTAQSIGKGLEFGAEMLLPTGLPRRAATFGKKLLTKAPRELTMSAMDAEARALRDVTAAMARPGRSASTSASTAAGAETMSASTATHAMPAEFASTDDVSQLLSGSSRVANGGDAISELRRTELMSKLGGQGALPSSVPPLPPAATVAERAAEKAFPLSARTSDPSRYAAGQQVDMPIREGLGAGKRLGVTVTDTTKAGKIKSIRVGDYDVDLSTLGPTKLTGDEMRDLVLGRGRVLAKAKGKQLPKDVVGELDRLGLEYRRTAGDIEKLQALPNANPQELQQLLQGKYELGYKLATQARGALMEAAKDETGAVNPAMLLMLGRASAVVSAGVTGYAVTDDPEDKLTNAVLAGTTAAFATHAIPAVYKAITGAAARGHVPATTAEEFMYGSMLSRPATIVRSHLGQISGAAHGILIRAQQGRFDDALAITTDLMTHAPGRYLKALSRGSSTLRLSGATGRRTTGGLAGLPLRLIAASDEAVVPALKAGGFTLDDAQRLTLQGVPSSEFGTKLVQAFSANWLGRLMAPFVKVGIHSFEQPLATFVRTDLEMSERVARGALMATSFGVGATQSGERDLRHDPFKIALAGPNAIPMALGLAYSWATENDKDAPAAMLKALSMAGPIDTDAGSILRGLPGRAIPGVAGDIARMMDPQVREHTGVRENLQMRIPGHAGGYGRESLPAREAPIDIFGAELPGQRNAESAFGRLFLGDPSAANLPTRYPHDNPTARSLKDLDINMGTPRADLTVAGEAVDVPPGAARTITRTKGQVVERILTTLMQTPGWERLDPEQKKVAVEQGRKYAGTLTGSDAMRRMLMLAIVEELQGQGAR